MPCTIRDETCERKMNAPTAKRMLPSSIHRYASKHFRDKQDEITLVLKQAEELADAWTGS